MALIDITGQRFGRWVVIGFDKIKYECAFWISRCDCGKIKSVSGVAMRRGQSTGCGCRKLKRSSTVIDIKGQVFGRLTVLSLNEKISPHGGCYWDCICECGKRITTLSARLKSGQTKSCGCLQVDLMYEQFKTHGLSKHPIFGVWNTMIQRCTNKNVDCYPHYGGRGVMVCDRWLSFEFFCEDMLDSYVKGLTLEREDVNGNYEKSNCSWQSMYTQSRNRTDNVFMTHMGETMVMTDWAKKVGISKKTIWWRLSQGWSDADALSVPINTRRKKIQKDN